MVIINNILLCTIWNVKYNNCCQLGVQSNWVWIYIAVTDQGVITPWTDISGIVLLSYSSNKWMK